MFEIIYEDINIIDHNNDFWAQRDTQMNLEVPIQDTQLQNTTPLKKIKKKTKIIKKIEKEYEIVNDIKKKNKDEIKEIIKKPIIPIKKQENLKKKE